MSKKSILALMVTAMQPTFAGSASKWNIRSAIPSQGCQVLPSRKSGVAAVRRQARRNRRQK